MNHYDNAVASGEQKEFLLGRGKYFYLDRDWGGHDSSRTAVDLLEFAQRHGERVLYEELNKDMKDALNDMKISSNELLSIINYISIYFRRKKDGEYKTLWSISANIKTLIKQQMILKEKHNEDLSNHYFLLDSMKEQFEIDLH